VRTRHSHPLPRSGERVDAKSFTGELVGATESEVTLAADGGMIAIPYSDIRRSNLVED
jgi:ribosome maturation factor RimP